MNKKRLIQLIIVGFLLLILISLELVYAIYNSTNKERKFKIGKTGCVDIIYSDETSYNLYNPKGYSDEDGVITTPVTITIDNRCKNDEEVELQLDVLKESLIDIDKIKVYINGGYDLKPTKLSELRTINNSDENIDKTIRLFNIIMKPYEVKRINMRLWLDENSPTTNDKNIFLSKYKVSSGDDLIKPNLMEAIKNTELKEKDDTYYYTGNISNNNIKIGNYDFKILSIKDDNVKIIYSSNDLESNYSDASYLEQSVSLKGSRMENFLTDWYDNNLKEFEEYIKDYDFCNDTSYKYENRLEYGSYIRVFKDNNTSLNCPETDKKYGGIYNKKIGLITLDEVFLAGGTLEDNTNYFLYDGNDYYTMSPAFNQGAGFVGIVTSTGKIDSARTNSKLKVRPVINIKGDLLVDGDGSINNPYIIINE